MANRLIELSTRGRSRAGYNKSDYEPVEALISNGVGLAVTATTL